MGAVRSFVPRLCAVLFLVLAACGDTTRRSSDAGSVPFNDDLDGGGPCRSAGDCDDGVFCNGVERCEKQLCVAGTPRDCDDGIECTIDSCDEDSVSCRHLGPDADGDGLADARCTGPGGLPFGVDCDDEDPLRFPGNIEVCDTDNHDEDCDVTTYGARDMDEDGHNDVVCCNENAEGTALCGDDCVDTDPDISPSKQEICNDVDDDCSGSVDEGLPLAAWYPDCDGDGFGDAAGTPISDCSSPPASAMCGALGGTWVPSAGDCDESVAGRNPGAPEVCNFQDDDCDGLIDDVMSGAVVCYSGEKRSCTNVCGQPGEETCSASCLGFSACLANEACNGCDDDGDGSADDGFACARGLSEDCTTSCGTPGTHICSGTCDWGQCRAGSESCNYCDDDGDGDLFEERVLATSQTLGSGFQCGAGEEVFGTALNCAPVNNVGSLDFYAQLLPGAAVDEQGAYWVHTGVFSGWGRVVVEAQVEARVIGAGEPLGGWSLVVADDDVSDLGLTKTGAVGIAVDWNWAGERAAGDFGIPPGGADRFTYRKLVGLSEGNARGVIPLSPDSAIGSYMPYDAATFLEAGTNNYVTQKIVLDYTPDDPVTLLNEEVVVVTAGSNSPVTFQADQNANTTDPLQDMGMHVPLAIGFLAQSRAHNYDNYNGAPPGGVDYGAKIEARVKMSVMTFQGGSLPPVWTYHTKYSRYQHCPGL